MLEKIAAAVVVGVVAAGAAVSPAAAFSYSTPSTVARASATPTTVTMKWTPVTGAPGYRVRVAANSEMSGAKVYHVTTSSVVATDLAPAKRYWFRVAVENPRTRARLSAYTRAPYPSTTTTQVAAPTNLRSTGQTVSSVALAWNRSEGATGYRIAASSDDAFTSPRFAVSTSPEATFTSLSPGQSYWVRVQARRPDGSLSTWGAPVQAATPKPATATTPPTSPGAPADLRFASFNVFSVSLDSTVGNRLPWKDRRGTVISEILGEKVDVLGVQEANQSKAFASRLVDGENQYMDLVNGLNKAGGTYAVTNENAVNCVNPTTSYNCVPQYQGASNADRILYDTTKVTPVSQGSMKYDAQNPKATTDRYLAWAVFRVNATGEQFLFTTTHLDPTDPTYRRQQWWELITKVKALRGSLPVVVVGDFNTQKFDVLTKEMLPAMKTAGFGDVLNQQYNVNPSQGVRAQRLVNGWINSLGRYDRNVRNYAYEDRRDKTGNGIDWIFASNALAVKEWKVVLDYDPTTLQVRGIMPSDHNMVRATITIP